MDTILQFVTAALTPLHELSLRIGAVLPTIAASLVLLVVGAFGAYWARYLSDYILKAIKIDDYARQLGVSAILNRLGVGPSPTHLTGVVVYATILLSFVLGAAEVVGFPVVSEFLRRIVDFMPKCMAAVFVLGCGLFWGDLLGRIVHRAAEANHIKGSDSLMKVTHGVIVIFSGIVGLEYLGIDIQTLSNNYMLLVVGSLGLGIAIAMGVSFGMAGRDTAERWIRDLTPKSKAGIGNGPEPKMRVVR